MTVNSNNSPDANKPKRKLDREQLLISVGIALGLVLIIFGFRATQTGRDESGLPDVIERMSPADGDRVLRQSQIIVDFVEGYEAVMFIDGTDRYLPTKAESGSLRTGVGV